jgi:hypothetical protein
MAEDCSGDLLLIAYPKISAAMRVITYAIFVEYIDEHLLVGEDAVLCSDCDHGI